MRQHTRSGRVNVKALIILLVVVGVIGGGAAVGYKVRKRMVAQSSLEAGKAALAKQDWLEASKHLKQYLAKYPNDREVLFEYAQASQKIRPTGLDHIGASVAAYRRLLRLNPDNESAICRSLIRLYMKTGDPGEAAYIADLWREKAPPEEKAEALLWKAKALILQRKYNEALAPLSQLVQAYPNEAEAYFLLSGLAARDDSPVVRDVARTAMGSDAPQDLNSTEAFSAALLDVGVKRNPQSASLLANRARFRREMFKAQPVNPGEDKEQKHAEMRELVLSDLRAAEELKSKDPGVLFFLFDEYMDASFGDPQRAGAVLEAIDGLDAAALARHDLMPEDLMLPRLKAAANLALRLGKGDDAVRMAEEALKKLGEKDERLIDFLPAAAELYLAAGKTGLAEETVQRYKLVIADRPGVSQAARDQADALDAALSVARQDWRDVIQRLEPVVTGGRAVEPLSLLRLAHAYSSTGEHRRLLQMLEAHPEARTQPPILEYAIRACLAQGRLTDAARYASVLLPVVSDKLELVLLCLQARTEAALRGVDADGPPLVELITQVSQQHPQSVELRVQLARLLLKAGQKEQALAVIDKAIQECSDPLPARLLLVNFYRADAEDPEKSKAQALCREIIEQTPQTADPRLLLAEMQLNGGHKEEAISTLETAIEALEGSEKDKAINALIQLYLNQTDSNERKNGFAMLKERAKALQQRDPAAGGAGADSAKESATLEEIRVLLALLQQKEAGQELEECQQFVDRLKQLEGERGLRWRLEQVRLWMNAARSIFTEEELRDFLQRRLHAAQMRAKVEQLKAMLQPREARAAELMNHCISADPAWSEPVVVLGFFYQLAGSDLRAEELYRRWLQSRPGHPVVTNELLNLLQAHGRMSELEEVRKTLAAENPLAQAVLARHTLGPAIAAGEFETAIQDLRRRVEQNPTPEGKTLLAMLVHRQQKDSPEPMELLEQVRSANPEYFPAVAATVAVLNARGDNEPARKLIETELARIKADPKADPEVVFEAHKLRADLLFMIGEYEEAEKAFIHLTTLPDPSGSAYAALGLFYRERKDEGKALAAWEQGVKTAPDNLEALTLLVNSLLTGNQPEQLARARALVDAQMKRVSSAGQPASADAALLTLDGAILRAENKPEEARKRLEEVVVRDPRHVAAYLQLIDMARERGEIRRARELIARALGANRNHPRILTAQAALEDAEGNGREALEAARQAAAADPQSVEARNTVTKLALRLGDIQTAEEYNRQALALQPADSTARLLRPRLLAGRGQTQQAFEELKAYAESEAGDKRFEAQVVLADLYIDAREWVLAEKLIDSIQELDRGNLDVLRVRLKLFMAQNDYGSVVNAAIAHPRKDARDTSALMLAANLLTLQGRAQFDRAIDLYRRALEVDEYQQQALNDLAWILAMEMDDSDQRANRQRLEEAYQLATRGADRYPDDAHLADTCCAICEKLARSQEEPMRSELLQQARRHGERALELTATLPATRVSTLRRLASVYLALGQKQDAFRSATEALRIDERFRGISNGRQGVLKDADRAELEALLKNTAG
jgi:tetratricopeptide (TPR) repeat protein